MAFDFSKKKLASKSDWLILATKNDETVLVARADTRLKALNRMVKKRKGYSNYTLWEARLATTLIEPSLEELR